MKLRNIWRLAPLAATAVAATGFALPTLAGDTATPIKHVIVI
jgi:hypothetical protein